MRYPNFNEEKKLWDQGNKFVVGLDESGRGPLAGPVVAVALMININPKKYSDILNKVRIFLKIKDGKKLSEEKRQGWNEKIINHKNIQWGIGVVSEKIIDKINILEATKLAMEKALKDLSCKSDGRRIGRTADFLLIDGNFKINSQTPQKSIIKADEKVFSCTAAGIIAKVARDRIMIRLHKKYPRYGFKNHKGYGTQLHLQKLKRFGPCPIHRKSFSPVRTCLN